MHSIKVILHYCEVKMCLLRCAGMRRRFVKPRGMTFKMCILTFYRTFYNITLVR